VEILFLVILLHLMMVILLWLMYTNEITYTQRILIHNIIMNKFIEEKDLKLYVERMSALKKVNYNKHLFYVTTFRNAYTLYDIPNLQIDLL